MVWAAMTAEIDISEVLKKAALRRGRALKDYAVYEKLLASKPGLQTLEFLNGV